MSDDVLLDELRRLEERLHAPEVRASEELISRLIADGFVEIGSSGRIYDKATILAELQGEAKDGGFGKVTAREYTLRKLGPDLALLTYLSEHHPPSGTVRRSRRSSFWHRIDGRWQMSFHQGTPVV